MTEDKVTGAHTPPVWTYGPVLTWSENHRGFDIYGPDGFTIAGVMPLDVDGVKGEANAALIAAAPELLEALKATAHWYANAGSWIFDQPCWCGQDGDEDAHEDSCIAARVALAKATGS